MIVNYFIPINSHVEGSSTTVYKLTIEGSRKFRRKQFGKYVKKAFGVTKPRHLARQLGFKDLM